MVQATSTPETVREITGSELSDQTLQTFIDAASNILGLSQNCLRAAGLSLCDMDPACTYLAAHLLTSSSVGDQSATVKREKFENYEVERVVGEFSGKGILGTTYGQTANAMTGGCLQLLDKSPAGIAFFG